MDTSLSYPLTAPQPGAFTEVQPGVLWLRLPLGGPLGHINVWALLEADGWTLVDTGMGSPETIAVWEQLLAQAPFDKPLQRVVVTHMHPDHVGLAGWFTRRFGVPLWMSRLEYLHCRVLAGDTGKQPPEDALRFYRAAGWNPQQIDAYRERFGRFGRYIHEMPDSYRRLTDGDRIRMAGSSWEVVGGNGHSPEHSSLYCAERKLLISGDQVLPRISSNVSVQPTEPGANPMADWMGSLAKMRIRVPADVLVLPSHNDCFHGLHTRLEQLRSGQEDALSRLREGLREPKRIVDVFPYLFRRPIPPEDASLLGMATGESVACLNFLLATGEVAKRSEAGVDWYALA